MCLRRVSVIWLQNYINIIAYLPVLSRCLGPGECLHSFIHSFICPCIIKPTHLYCLSCCLGLTLRGHISGCRFPFSMLLQHCAVNVCYLFFLAFVEGLTVRLAGRPTALVTSGLHCTLQPLLLQGYRTCYFYAAMKVHSQVHRFWVKCCVCKQTPPWKSWNIPSFCFRRSARRAPQPLFALALSACHAVIWKEGGGGHLCTLQ